ncbi:YlzJ-like family protein [Virgibacillus sp. NKC19-3]|uniref:YlzJ-like family protein n=1 Tax=Virgibacillus saliphilus TaxID=2831674 RepID=UPI001C9AA1E7|nr:YlzJ-like family protein [Virgibacillus sp. NKC19-3]MBY7143612.1 YlzJ-like family protein [Virgibacillus sp. NKC19-3]
MILYTPMSEAEIFPQSPDSFTSRHVISYDGRSLYVEKTDEGNYQLLQLMSTDPQDFLDEKYTPGNILPKKN